MGAESDPVSGQNRIQICPRIGTRIGPESGQELNQNWNQNWARIRSNSGSSCYMIFAQILIKIGIHCWSNPGSVPGPFWTNSGLGCRDDYGEAISNGNVIFYRIRDLNSAREGSFSENRSQPNQGGMQHCAPGGGGV